MTKSACFKASVLVCAIALFWLSQPVVMAQLTTGGIVGTVTDPSGSRIPGVTVTATQVATSTVSTTVTDSSGNYGFTNLQIGKYSLTFQKEGFQRVIQSNVDLGIAQVIRFDTALKIGSVSQTIEVTDAPPLLQTETSSLGSIETEKRIEDLPLNGRNFFKLTYLAPGTNEGATGTSAGAGSTDNNRPGTALSVNGMRIFDNNFLLDGMDNNEFGNGTVVIQPPPDSIQEFRIEQNSMSAEYGRGGAMVSLVLRSGTNQLHGAAWEFIRNNKFDARNYFATSGLGFQRNEFGGQLGGPIKKDKIFLFGSIQRRSIREEIPFISTVPTALMHSGNFSELVTPTSPNPIHNPFTGTNYSNNTIPACTQPPQPGCINSVGQNIVNLYPNENIFGPGGATLLTNNFIFNGKYKFDETSFLTRFDYNISAKDRFFAHYAIASPKATNPSNFPNVDGGLGSGTSSTLDNRVQGLAFDWNHIFNPGLLNDVRVGFNRFKDATLPLDFGSNAGNAVGIPNANHGGNSSGLTKINISGFQQLGDSLWVPETIAENVYQLADTLSWTRGRHSFKFGVDFRRQQRNFFQQTAPSGWLQFFGNYSGYGLADTLLGIPQSTLQDHLAGTVDPTRYWDLSEFVQDNIRVTPNLTLNLGLRYEINSPANGPTVGNFNLQTLAVNTSSHGGVKFDKNDWAPRVGFAWNVRPNTVVRSAFGIFYAAEGNIFDDLGLNPPSLAVLNFNYSASNPSTNQLLGAFPAAFTQPDPANPYGVVRTTGVIGSSSFDPVRRIPRIYEWNLTVEQQLTQNWLFRIGYVGTKSNNLFDHESSNLNQPEVPLDSNFGDAGTQCPGGFTVFNQGRPYFATRPCLNTVLPLDVARLSMLYNGLQTSVEHRFAGGFNVLAAYTFAKSLGTADGNVNQCDVQNAHNVAAERGPTTPDFRHQLTVSYVYELPYGKGKHFGSSANSVAQAVLGGWQVAGVTRARSGEAFDVLLGGDVTNTGAFPPRPDAIHNPYDFSFDVGTQQALGCSKPGHQTLDCWFNQAAFVVPALSSVAGDCGTQCFARDFGNARRAALRGPDMVNFDFSAYKTFQLGERFGLEFRAEFFNIFNHPAFNLPNLGSGGGSSGAGIVNFSCTSAAAPVPTDCGARSAGGAAITSTLPDAQREIQFGLKLQF